MELAFGQVSEQIGTALLPLLAEFTTWLTSPEGQETLDQVVEGVTLVIEELSKMAKWVIDNQDWLLPMVVAIGGVTAAWNIATAAVNGFKFAAGIAAFVSGSAVATTGAVLAGSATGGFMEGQQVIQNANILSGGTRFEEGRGLFGGAFQAPAPVINNNITVQTNATATAIADAINRANRNSGTNLIAR